MIDGRIRLQVVYTIASSQSKLFWFAICAADNSCSYRVSQMKRAAQSNNKLSNTNSLWRTQFCNWQLLIRVDTQQCEIRGPNITEIAAVMVSQHTCQNWWLFHQRRGRLATKRSEYIASGCVLSRLLLTQRGSLSKSNQLRQRSLLTHSICRDWLQERNCKWTLEPILKPTKPVRKLLVGPFLVKGNVHNSRSNFGSCIGDEISRKTTLAQIRLVEIELRPI